jgi:hypothetical protein
MNLESRMQLHVLTYKIVSLRIICGNYEDSATVRTKLEAETRKRILKLRDIESTSELEAAESLYNMYEDKVKTLDGVMAPAFRAEPSRITLSI